MFNIYIDTSASMNELGKSDSVEIIVKSLKEQFNDLKISYNIEQFINLDLSSIDDDSILISDGLFETHNIQKGISVAVGIDANINNLKQVSKMVYTVDEITKLDDYILYHYDFDVEEEDDEW